MSTTRRIVVATREAAGSFGGLGRAGRLAGHGPDYLMRNSWSLSGWGHCLDVWGIDPRLLAAWSFAAFEFEQDGALEQAALDASAMARRRTEPEAAKRIRRAFLNGTLAATEGDEAWRAEVREIDVLRASRPRRAVERAEELVNRATSAESAVRGLIGWAAALRVIRTDARNTGPRLRRCHVLLWMGVRLGAAAGLPVLVADVLQQLVFVESARSGDGAQVRRLAKAMVGVLEQAGREGQRERGIALASLGFDLYEAGRTVEAGVAYDRGLELLGQKLDRTTGVGDPLASARMLWLGARLAIDRGDSGWALETFERVLGLLSRQYPVESAMVLSEAVAVGLRSEQFSRSAELSQGLTWAVGQLERSRPGVASALATLVALAPTFEARPAEAMTAAEALQAVSRDENR